jgi:hypothetical protein
MSDDSHDLENIWVSGTAFARLEEKVDASFGQHYRIEKA